MTNKQFDFIDRKYFELSIRLIRNQEIDDDLKIDGECVLIVSHIWKEPSHPDPTNFQFNMINKFLLENKDVDSVFYGYMSLPQKPRDESAELRFRNGLNGMNVLYSGGLKNSKFLQIYPDFHQSFNRSWIIFECYCMRNFKMELMPEVLRVYQIIRDGLEINMTDEIDLLPHPYSGPWRSECNPKSYKHRIVEVSSNMECDDVGMFIYGVVSKYTIEFNFCNSIHETPMKERKTNHSKRQYKHYVVKDKNVILTLKSYDLMYKHQNIESCIKEWAFDLIGKSHVTNGGDIKILQDLLK